jgi:LuxR family transcriptional regulator, maltose regulon positive regulatory protein
VIGQWLALSDDAALIEDPTMALIVAAYRLAVGDPGEVAWWTAVAEANAGSECLPDGERREAFLALLHAIVAADGLHVMRAQAARACRLFRPSSHWRFLACAFEAVGLNLEGDAAAALSEFDALILGTGARMPPAEAGGQAFFALAAIDEGDWAQAESRIEHAKRIVREVGLEEKPGQALTFAVSALCHARVRATSDAMSDWNHAHTLLGHMTGFEPWAAVLARCTLARTSILLGDLAAARTLKDEAAALLDALPGWEALLPRVESVTALIDREIESTLTGGARSLTPAELRVLGHLPTHLSLGEIAAELFVTRNTVKSQAVAVYRKLDVASRSDAVLRARELGLLESAPE